MDRLRVLVPGALGSGGAVTTRVIAAGVLGVVLALIVAGSVLAGYRWADGKWQAEIARRDAEAAKYTRLWQERHFELSSAFEAYKAARLAARPEIRREVERIIERPVYRNVCADDDGLRLLNAVRAGTVPAPAGEPARAVPATARGEGENGSGDPR